MGAVQVVPIPTDLERPCGSSSASCRLHIPVGTRSQSLAFSLGGHPCVCPCSFPPGAVPHFPAWPRGADQILQSLQVPCVNFQTSFGFLVFLSPRISREHNKGRGEGGQERGGAGREGLEPGILTRTRLMALAGAAHRAPYVSHIKAGSAACANSTGISRSRDNGIPRERLARRRDWGFGRVPAVKWRPPQSVLPAGAGKRLSPLSPAAGTLLE